MMVANVHATLGVYPFFAYRQHHGLYHWLLLTHHDLRSQEVRLEVAQQS